MNKDFWDKVKRLEELAKKATPGPWDEYNDPRSNMIEGKNCEWVMGLDERYRCPFIFGDSIPDALSEAVGEFCEARVDISEANLSYIAAANPAMIQEMIAELKRLEKENDRLKIELHDMDSSGRDATKDYNQL